MSDFRVGCAVVFMVYVFEKWTVILGIFYFIARDMPTNILHI